MEANIDRIGQELFGLVDQDGRRQIVLDFFAGGVSVQRFWEN
ncbi:MAG: hypothetical protein R3C49_14865 [Planctomycetaceae bacterium]